MVNAPKCVILINVSFTRFIIKLLWKFLLFFELYFRLQNKKSLKYPTCITAEKLRKLEKLSNMFIQPLPSKGLTSTAHGQTKTYESLLR